jgi:multiple sugar transport system substrate-binding protein
MKHLKILTAIVFAISVAGVSAQVLEDAPFEGWVPGLPKIQAPKGFDWRQYEGVTINLNSENTTPSVAIAANIQQFEKVTGITVNVEQADLSLVMEKEALDVNAKTAKYQVIYADPYQILSSMAKSHFIDLNTFDNDPKLPHIPGGKDDFIKSCLEVCGYMGDRKALYALPYDDPTMVLAYRKDVIAKYKSLFQKEMGFDWTPGPALTWDQYYKMADWINKKVAAGAITEVKYGTGHMAKQYDSLQCDFSNVLAAFGGDYFQSTTLGGLGAPNPGKSAASSAKAIAAAKFYKSLVAIAAPGSTSWDWSGLAESFSAGEIVLAPEFHEFSAMFENQQQSKVAGKVGWAILPKGPARSGNIYGGTGLSISKYASEKEKGAAWLFVLWATSPQTMYMCLKSDVGGSTPSRYSVYNLPDVKKGIEQPDSAEAKAMPNLLPMKAVLAAWEEKNVYMRPKVPQWNEVDTLIYTELSKMLANNGSPESAMKTIAQKSNLITGN